MKSINKILFALADKDTEDYLATVIKEDCPNSEIVGIVTYKEKLIQKVNQLEPDILILRETLPGSLNISDLLFELRYSYPNVRIIFMAGDRKAGDPFLVTLVTYGIYDLLVGGKHKISDIIELINIPNEFKDVNYLIPKAALNELTNTVTFDSPIVVSSKKKDIIVVEENNYYDYGNDNKRTSFREKQRNKYKNKENIKVREEKHPKIEESDFIIDDIDIYEEDKKGYISNSQINKPKFKAPIIEENEFNNLDVDIDFDDIDLGVEDDIDFEFDDIDFETNKAELEINSSNETDFDIEFNDESTDDTEFEIEFDETNHTNDIDFEIDFDDKENINSILDTEEDDDLLIDIDLNSLKENRNKSINDILLEEEGEDIVFEITNKNTHAPNVNSDKSYEKNNELESNSNEEYSLNNKNTNKQQSKKEKTINNYAQKSTMPKKEVSNECDLESLTAEIEKMRQETSDAFEIIEENSFEFNKQYNSNVNDEYIEENTSKENRFNPITNRLPRNNKQNQVVVSRQKIISFIGGKNGVGTSSIAINTAVTLAQQGHKVIYLEINNTHPTIGYWYQIGHVNQGLETAMKAVESNNISQIDRAIIKTSEIKKQNKKLYKKLPDNLDFLLFSKQETILKDKKEEFNPNRLKDLFLLLMIELEYDFVILDLDFDVSNEYTTTSLSFSNLIYAIATQDMSSLAYLLFKIDELERNGRNIKNKCRYIVNKYEGKDVEINLKDLKDWLNSKKVNVVPENNRDFINANTLSIPIVSYTRDDKLKKSFNDISKEILSNE